MSYKLRQSTASQIVWLGRFLDNLDGDTAKTALSIANTDIKVRKAGATAGVSKNSGGATHDANGYYYATFDATDTDTLGPNGVISCKMTGALDVRHEFEVLAADVWDALYASSGGKIRADATHAGGTAWASGAITAASIATAALTAAKFAANAIDAGALATDAVTEIQAGLATAANLATAAGFIDTEVAAILAAVGTTLPAQIAALSIPTANANADALLDRASAVDTYTLRQAMRLMLALMTGEITFAGNVATVKAADGSKVRATFETNPQEERLNGVLDAT